jgi:hypothetical protein
MMTKLKALVTVRPVWLLVVAVAVTALLGYLSGLLTPLQPSMRAPLLDINDGMMLGVLAALGLFVGHLYSRLGKVEDRNLALEDRIAKLETARGEAIDKLASAASFINRVGLWLRGGQRGPMPEPPEQILPHIDAELWDVPDAVGGTE